MKYFILSLVLASSAVMANPPDGVNPPGLNKGGDSSSTVDVTNKNANINGNLNANKNVNNVGVKSVNRNSNRANSSSRSTSNAVSSSNSRSSAKSGSKSNAYSGDSSAYGYSGGNSFSTTVTTEGSDFGDRVPDVYAPPLTSSFATDLCLGSMSGGASGSGFGISIGGTTEDEGCTARHNARLLTEMQMKPAAVALLCEYEGTASAMKLAGYCDHLVNVTPEPVHETPQGEECDPFGNDPFCY